MKNNVHPIFQNIFANVLGELPPKASCPCDDDQYCEAHAQEAAMQRERERENDRLIDAMVSDDLRAEADLIKQGEMEARFEMLLEQCWENQNGLAYVESQSRLAKAGR